MTELKAFAASITRLMIDTFQAQDPATMSCRILFKFSRAEAVQLAPGAIEKDWLPGEDESEQIPNRNLRTADVAADDDDDFDLGEALNRNEPPARPNTSKTKSKAKGRGKPKANTVEAPNTNNIPERRWHPDEEQELLENYNEFRGEDEVFDICAGSMRTPGISPVQCYLKLKQLGRLTEDVFAFRSYATSDIDR